MMLKRKLTFALTVLISGYSAQAWCTNNLSIDHTNAQVEQRVEMEQKQQQLTHTKDYVSDKRGARDSLLSSPVKKEDAITNQPIPQP